MRRLVLHARARQAGPVALGLIGVAVAAALLPRVIHDTEMLAAVVGPLAAVSLLGFALGGADPALERTLPQRWPRWRAAELAICALAAGVALTPALAAEPATLRNLAGLGGLTALGAVWPGPRLAWVVPSAVAFTGAAAGPDADWLPPVTWIVAEADTGRAYAAALAVAGTAALVRLGPPVTR